MPQTVWVGSRVPPARPLAPLFVLLAVPAPSTAQAHGPHLLPFKREGRKHPWCLSVCLSHSFSLAHFLSLTHTHTDRWMGSVLGCSFRKGRTQRPSPPPTVVNRSQITGLSTHVLTHPREAQGIVNPLPCLSVLLFYAKICCKVDFLILPPSSFIVNIVSKCVTYYKEFIRIFKDVLLI